MADFPFQSMSDDQKKLYNAYLKAKSNYENYVISLSRPAKVEKKETKDGPKIIAPAQPKEEKEPEQPKVTDPDERARTPEETGAPETAQEGSDAALRSEHGLGPRMTQKKADQLKKYCEALMEAGSALLSGIKGAEKAPLEKQNKLGYEVRSQMRAVQREMHAIEQLDMSAPDELPGYQTMHSNASEITIDAKDQMLDTFGAGLSSRINLRYMNSRGEVISGFFTPDTNPNFNKQEYFTQLILAKPEMKDLINKFQFEENLRKDFIDQFININEANNLLTFFKKNDFDETLYDHIDWNDNNLEAIFRCFQQFKDFDGIQRMNNDNGIPKGSNLNQRNSAMSDVASLMGCGKLVAQSRSMQMMVKGNIISGNFMDHAKGLSWEEIDPDTPFFQGRKLVIDYNSLGRSCARMMALDYICCNTDRHALNMFYIVEPSDDNKTMILKGIQGIDNDSSFGTKEPKDPDGLQHLPPLSAIKFMPKDTADMILKLNENSLKAMLMQRKLSEDEVEACVSRLKKLQERLKDPNKIKILEDTEIFTEKQFNQQAIDISNNNKTNKKLSPFVNCYLNVNNNFKQKYDKYLVKVKNYNNKAEELLLKSYTKKVKTNRGSNDNMSEAEKRYLEYKDSDSGDNKFLIPEGVEQKLEAKATEHVEHEKKKGKLIDVLGVTKWVTSFISQCVRPFFTKSWNAAKQLFTRKNTAKKLQTRIQMEDTCGLRGQKLHLDELLKNLPKKGEDEKDPYSIMCDKAKELSDFMKKIDDEMKQRADNKKNPSAKDPKEPALCSLDGKVLSDFAHNKFREKLNALQNAVKDYMATEKNEYAYIAEQLGALCTTMGMDLERKVNDLNEVMSATFRRINEWDKESRKLEQQKKRAEEVQQKPEEKRTKEEKNLKAPDPGEIRLYTAGRDVRLDLARYLSDLKVPDKEEISRFPLLLAELAVSEHIRSLKISNPEQYEQFCHTLGKCPEDGKDGLNCLKPFAEELLKDEDFRKAAEKIPPSQSISCNAAGRLLNIAKNLNLLQNLEKMLPQPEAEKKQDGIENAAPQGEQQNGPQLSTEQGRTLSGKNTLVIG